MIVQTIIDCWIWSETWGIYQAPLSFLFFVIMYSYNNKIGFLKAVQIGFLIFLGSNLLFWTILFLPIHSFISKPYHLITASPIKLIALFTALIHATIQSILAHFFITKKETDSSNLTYPIFAAHIAGAATALFLLRFVATVIE